MSRRRRLPVTVSRIQNRPCFGAISIAGPSEEQSALVERFDGVAWLELITGSDTKVVAAGHDLAFPLFKGLPQFPSVPAVLTDGAAHDTISATVASRRVDNSPVRGADIQTANGTDTAGRLGAGDTMTFPI